MRLEFLLVFSLTGFTFAVGCGPGDAAEVKARSTTAAAPEGGLIAPETVAKSGPVDTLRARADRLSDEGQWAEALTIYQQLRPSAEVLKRTGFTQLRLWDLRGAIRTLRRARELSPDDLETTAYLAEALTLNRELDEALLVHREILARDSTNVDARASYALTMAWLGDLTGAVREYRLALSYNPRHFRARTGLAQALSWRKDFDAALAEYDRAAASTTDLRSRSGALSGSGQVLAWKGDLRGAVARYGAALQANPRNTGALFGLAEVHEWLREYPRAKSLYEEILQIEPDHKGAKAKLTELMWVR